MAKFDEGGFLVLTRNLTNSDIVIDDDILIRVMATGRQVRIGIKSIDGKFRKINRREVWENLKAEEQCEK